MNFSEKYIRFLYVGLALSICIPLHGMLHKAYRFSPALSCASSRTFHTSSLVYNAPNDQLSHLMQERDEIGKHQRKLSRLLFKTEAFACGSVGMAGGGLALIYLGGYDVIHSLCSSCENKEFILGCGKLLFGTGVLTNCGHLINILVKNRKEIEWEQKRLDLRDKELIDEMRELQK